MEHLIESLLNVPEVRVLGVEYDERGDLFIEVESTLKGTTCRRCGQPIEAFHGYDRPVQLRHLPIFEREVYLRIRPKRYRCERCEGGPTTTQRCQWFEPNSPHTRAFEQSMLRALINATVADVSRKHALSEAALEGIVHRHFSTQVDWQRIDQLNVIGIDEIALRKGHGDFVVIVTNRDRQGRIDLLGVLPDRRKETVTGFIKAIPLRLKATVQAVCTDMYEGFVNAAQEQLPQAAVVIDRFHVAKTYRECVDTVRKREVKRLKQELPQQQYAAVVKDTLWLLRKPWGVLSPQERERLEGLFELTPQLRAAHLMREVLTAIFDQAQGKAQAQQWLEMWCQVITAEAITGFERFLGTLHNHWDEITNYFLNRQSSGFVEGFNNKIKVLKRRCYGIFNLGHLFQRIRLDLEGYRLFATA